jgi:hypothetical protein
MSLYGSFLSVSVPKHVVAIATRLYCIDRFGNTETHFHHARVAWCRDGRPGATADTRILVCRRESITHRKWHRRTLDVLPPVPGLNARVTPLVDDTLCSNGAAVLQWHGALHG